MAHLTNNPDLTARVRRIAGQVAGVDRALADGTECAAILQQVAAVRGAVNGLLEEILEAHMREHVAAEGLTPAARAQGLDEALAAIRRYSK